MHTPPFKHESAGADAQPIKNCTFMTCDAVALSEVDTNGHGMPLRIQLFEYSYVVRALDVGLT